MFSKKEVGDKVVILGIRYLGDVNEKAMSGKIVGKVTSIKSTTLQVDTGGGIRSYYRKNGRAYSRGDYSKCTECDPELVKQENEDLLKKAKNERIEEIREKLESQSLIVLDKILRDMR